MKRIGMAGLALAGMVVTASAAERGSAVYACEGWIQVGSGHTQRDFSETFTVNFDEKTLTGQMINTLPYWVTEEVTYNFGWSGFDIDGQRSAVSGMFYMPTGTLFYRFFPISNPDQPFYVISEGCTLTRRDR